MKHIKVKKQKSTLESPVFMVVIILVATVLLVSVIRTYGSYRQTKQNLNDQINEQERLENYEEDLRGDLEFYDTPRGREELIRLQHPVVREGEELIVIVPSSEEDEILENSNE